RLLVASMSGAGSRRPLLALLRLQNGGDGGEHRDPVAGTVVANPVEKEGRRSIHAVLNPLSKVAPDLVPIDMSLHFVIEPVGVESDRLGVRQEIFVFERLLVGEEYVVHLPELSLRAGRLGRL